MPFTPTTTPPKTDAKITVAVAGLMVLESAAGDTCEIGIHRFDKDHTFQASLIVQKPNRPPRLIRLQTGIPTSDFTINLYTSTAFVGVRAFVPTASFNRDDKVDNLLDCRWGFNVRSLPNHANVKRGPGASPLVKLNTGILYTPTLSRPGQSIKQVCGSTSTNLNRVAADLAFAIDMPGDLTLPTSPKVMINWTNFGKPQDLVLPRPGEEGETTTTYTLWLLNDPAVIDPTAHDELKLYYDVLEKNGGQVPNIEQCRLDIGAAPKSDQIPCLPVLLDP